jgi:hypothetical protein
MRDIFMYFVAFETCPMKFFREISFFMVSTKSLYDEL